MEEINPKDIISPCFHKVFDDIFLGRHIHYWLKGGRGSTKSSFISIMVVLTIFESYLKYHSGQISQAELSNAICFRKVGNSLRNSVGSQIKWAIDQLHLSSLFTERTAVNQFVFNPTGQLIFLAGCDDPQKIKSIKPRVGFFQCVWFEELAEFTGMEEIRNLLQSVIRGGENFRIFYSYNPPQVRQNWVNFESEISIPTRLVHHSTYLDVPPEWLGKQFIAEAELLKKTKPQNYEHEYMGIATGTGGTVFENIEVREITDEEIAKFDHIRQGIDWGFSVDPACFIRCHFDKTRRVLYLIDEIYQRHLFNTELMDMIKQRGYHHTTITADSAEPKSVSEFWYHGFLCYGARKKAQGKKGYVSYGVKFLQDLQKIVIDQRRTPNAHREFVLYEYEKDKDGEFKSDYPDKNNHSIDAVRYALEDDMEARGLF